MARQKGSKNKPKAPALDAGNPEFNLTGVEPSKTIGAEVAASAILPEDLEFDRELERMARTEEMPPDIEPEPIGATVKKVVEQRVLLSEVLEGYSPATTDQELREQVHTAKINGCDSIEATLKLCERFCRDPLLKDVGYFIYHDIKVYIEGEQKRASARDGQTIHQRVFGGSQIA